ncbi:carboxymuconolactone decarboxylase family protein [Candidatus Enterococcus clewellii]|uniref:Carboxymuconolactone decarboxylase-like domain-containing protein n=1 Tax=Candidatus Enterococcus clewellii TaxID=1834193 RepID=A0A242KBC3_9ENTE|nr:carboxymuconolactone decarboxylase family protein [Enterococcus sp. 9E7_DIV0242]OTP18452.1 hypothetical protein A5888_000266 [Enterococcus sp. 9E7_DIV0242]
MEQSKEYNRTEMNQLMAETDDFFAQFNQLDQQVYAEGAISKENKELMGLAISIVTKCDECILYHLEQCIELAISREKMIEAIKIGVIGGGSVTYPQARFAFKTLQEKHLL